MVSIIGGLFVLVGTGNLLRYNRLECSFESIHDIAYEFLSFDVDNKDI